MSDLHLHAQCRPWRFPNPPAHPPTNSPLALTSNASTSLRTCAAVKAMLATSGRSRATCSEAAAASRQGTGAP